MVKKKKYLSFEDALEQLETITAKLEAGSLTLEESMAAFQEGMQLSEYCQQTLEKADGSIKQLIENAQGDLELIEFHMEN